MPRAGRRREVEEAFAAMRERRRWRRRDIEGRLRVPLPVGHEDAGTGTRHQEAFGGEAVDRAQHRVAPNAELGRQLPGRGQGTPRREPALLDAAAQGVVKALAERAGIRLGQLKIQCLLNPEAVGIRISHWFPMYRPNWFFLGNHYVVRLRLRHVRTRALP